MKKQKTPSIVVIGVLTVITTVFWVGFGAFRAFTAKPPVKVPQEILEPLSPALDQKVLDRLSQRTFFEEYQIPESIISSPESPLAPTPAPAPPTTTSGQVQQSVAGFSTEKELDKTSEFDSTSP